MRQINIVIIVFVCAFLYVSSIYAAADTRGPLNITNNFPTTLLFFSYTPETTSTVKNKEFIMRFGVTESNTIIKDKMGTTEAIIDLELTRVHWNLFTGITDKFELGFEIPFLYYHKGFMDTPIEWTEARLGKVSRSRKELPRNDIRFLLVSDGDTIYDINTGLLGLGDMTLKFKYALVREDRKIPDVSLKFDLKFPTGNQDKALGSGGMDFGPALLLHKSYEKFHFQLQLGYFIFNDLEIERLNLKIRTANFFHSIFAIEYAIEKVSWIAQFSFNSNTFSRLSLEDINSSGQSVSLGFKYPFYKRWLFQFAFTENISSVAYPDFSGDIIIECRFDL